MRFRKLLTILFTMVSLATSAGTATAQEIERTLRDRLIDYITETYKISNASTIVDAVIRVSEQKDIEPTLLLAIIHVESRFQSKARNQSGAKGLLQVLYPAHKDKFSSLKMAYDPDKNIEVGATIWKDCEERSKTFKQTSRCYSGGANQWDKKVLLQKQKFDIIKEFL